VPFQGRHGIERVSRVNDRQTAAREMRPLLVHHCLPRQRVELRSSRHDDETARVRRGQKRTELRRELSDREEQLPPRVSDGVERPSKAGQIPVFRLHRASHRVDDVAPCLIADRRRVRPAGDDAPIDRQLERIEPLDIERAQLERIADLAEPQDRRAAWTGGHDGQCLTCTVADTG
jgi:hypothetical protein